MIQAVARSGQIRGLNKDAKVDIVMLFPQYLAKSAIMRGKSLAVRILALAS